MAGLESGQEAKSPTGSSCLSTYGTKTFKWLLLLAVFYTLLALSLLLASISSWSKAESLIVNRELAEEESTVEDKKAKQNLLLFIAVLSKGDALNRRSAIRSTWMSNCKKHNKITACLFFTDKTETLPKENRTIVEEEYLINKDMVFMPYTGGNNFALRLVWMLQWASNAYDFDFFLRMDDDHYLCLDRLVYELPHRPRNSLYWGFIHCREDIVRVDEGWLMLSSNLVHEALSKLNNTLPCHPFGDQAVAMWMLDSQFNVTYFYDNERIINLATSFHLEQYLRPDICLKYISLHGSYPKAMKMYWNMSSYIENVMAKTPIHYEIPPIPRYEDRCPFSNKIFDVNKFWPQFRFATKPCKDEPKWGNSAEEFRSRETYGEDD